MLNITWCRIFFVFAPLLIPEFGNTQHMSHNWFFFWITGIEDVLEGKKVTQSPKTFYPTLHWITANNGPGASRNIYAVYSSALNYTLTWWPVLSKVQWTTNRIALKQTESKRDSKKNFKRELKSSLQIGLRQQCKKKYSKYYFFITILFLLVMSKGEQLYSAMKLYLLTTGSQPLPHLHCTLTFHQALPTLTWSCSKALQL